MNFKKALRKEVRAAEKLIPAEFKTAWDLKIRQNVESLPEYRNAGTVFLFVGTSREISTDGLIEDSLAAGKTVAVPLCVGDGIMELKRLDSLAELRIGAYGIREPMADAPSIDPADVDFALIPCVSCDHGGKRLGQGGGFYDRFLEKYEGPAAMVCREALMREDIPVEAHDNTIDIVVSEAGVFRR